MTPATRRLHEQLLRLAKGMLSAWEEWLTVQPVARTTEVPMSSAMRRMHDTLFRACAQWLDSWREWLTAQPEARNGR